MNCQITLGDKERSLLDLSGVSAKKVDELPHDCCGLCGSYFIVGEYVIDAGDVWPGMTNEWIHFECWSREKDECC